MKKPSTVLSHHPLRQGYTGVIEARGRAVHVRNGVAEQDGKRIFIEKDGTVLGKKGEVVGHVATAKLTKGAPGKAPE